MDYTMPARGEMLHLPDGRVFMFTEIEPPTVLHRKQWWRALSESGGSTLQGNTNLRRRGLTSGWGFA